ncbi:MAG: GNAT family N-acetyltransferase [Chloroflexota bacterium]
MLRIEPATVHDLSGAYRVCLKTGAGGQDATDLQGDPDLLGHVYVGPYLARGEGTQLVVVDEAGVCGYLLSADDTHAHEAWAEAHWWPPLRRRHPITDADPRDLWLVRQIHEPPRLPDAIVAAYPAHLHLDLLERARGRGLGRALMERLNDELRARGVTAVHLGADPGNTNAIEFYAHLGFAVIEQLPDETVMGMRLDR